MSSLVFIISSHWLVIFVVIQVFVSLSISSLVYIISGFWLIIFDRNSSICIPLYFIIDFLYLKSLVRSLVDYLLIEIQVFVSLYMSSLVFIISSHWLVYFVVIQAFVSLKCVIIVFHYWSCHWLLFLVENPVFVSLKCVIGRICFVWSFPSNMPILVLRANHIVLRMWQTRATEVSNWDAKCQ